MNVVLLSHEASPQLHSGEIVAEFGSRAVDGNGSEWHRNALTDLPHKYLEAKALIFLPSCERRRDGYLSEAGLVD